jgi:hypothetical protein
MSMSRFHAGYSFTAGTALPFTASVIGSVTAADLNGDNKVDLAVSVAVFSHGVPSATPELPFAGCPKAN